MHRHQMYYAMHVSCHAFSTNKKAMKIFNHSYTPTVGLIMKKLTLRKSPGSTEFDPGFIKI